MQPDDTTSSRCTAATVRSSSGITDLELGLSFHGDAVGTEHEARGGGDEEPLPLAEVVDVWGLHNHRDALHCSHLRHKGAAAGIVSTQRLQNHPPGGSITVIRGASTPSS